MKQPPAHDVANVDLLAPIPPHASRVIEAGCSAGALARLPTRLHAGEPNAA